MDPYSYRGHFVSKVLSYKPVLFSSLGLLIVVVAVCIDNEVVCVCVCVLGVVCV